MKLIFVGAFAGCLVCSAAAASDVPEVVTNCLKAIDGMLAKDAKRDAFTPTESLPDARILMWQAPYSPAHMEEVATVVMVEGTARHRDDHAKQDDVTAKCGLTNSRVKFFDLLDGHGLPDPEPEPGR